MILPPGEGSFGCPFHLPVKTSGRIEMLNFGLQCFFHSKDSKPTHWNCWSINISNRNDLQAARLGNNFRLDTSMLCAGQVIIQSSCVKADLKIEIWSMYDSSGEFWSHWMVRLVRMLAPGMGEDLFSALLALTLLSWSRWGFRDHS